MMSSTQRDRKLIAHLASECGVLREAQVMSIRGLPAANQTGSLGYRFDVMTSRTRRGSDKASRLLSIILEWGRLSVSFGYEPGDNSSVGVCCTGSPASTGKVATLARKASSTR